MTTCAKCCQTLPQYDRGYCPTCRVLLGLSMPLSQKPDALAAIGVVDNRQRQECEPEPLYLPRPVRLWVEVNDSPKRVCERAAECPCQTCRMIHAERARQSTVAA